MTKEKGSSKSEAKNLSGLAPEAQAITLVYQALEPLSKEAQARVTNYVFQMLGITKTYMPEQYEPRLEEQPQSYAVSQEPSGSNEEYGLEGVSPIAKKWMIRNGLDVNGLSSLFSIGGDEIDIIVNDVPGGSKRERMHNVFLLKGIAAYLATGAARFTYDQVKDTCTHYKAYDVANYASYVKSFAADVSGSKSSEYSLTARGLSNGTELVKQILKPNGK